MGHGIRLLGKAWKRNLKQPFAATFSSAIFISITFRHPFSALYDRRTISRFILPQTNANL